MEVMTLLLFVGAVWVAGAVAFFAWNLRLRAHQHTDRLALLPLEDNWQDPRALGAAGLPQQTRKADVR
jgi:hypothetical protein